MNYTEFTHSLHAATPPAGLPVYLEALWYEGKGNWNNAHELVQDLNDKTAAQIHAYLHRKEGDIFNADYWYRCAGKTRPNVGLEEEWKQMVEELLVFSF